MVVVIDIDGTISDGKHREHHLDKTPPDWEAYLKPDVVGKDTPLPLAKRAIAKFDELGYPVIFLTGRNETLRDTTMRWLLEHFGLDIPEERLLMRPAGNMLRPTEFKLEQVQNIRREYGPSLMFIDDDKYMHSIYAEYGIALHAPECWTTMFPDHGELPPEDSWRK